MSERPAMIKKAKPKSKKTKPEHFGTATVPNAKRAVVQVGYGRGFVVSAGEYGRYIITAAHCLPRWRYPRAHLANGATELTFPRIIGALGSKREKRTISAELCFLNLADDVAVLAEPDGQIFWEECDQYQAFTEQAISIGRPPPPRKSYEWTVESETPAWLLSLDGEWLRCTVQNNGRWLSVRQGYELINSGMSGSCIADDNGAALGIVSTGGGTLFGDGGFHPSLTDCLPPWLLRKLDHA